MLEIELYRPECDLDHNKREMHMLAYRESMCVTKSNSRCCCGCMCPMCHHWIAGLRGVG